MGAFSEKFDITFWSPWLARAYRLLERSMRFEVVNFDAILKARAAGRRLVVVHWHDEIFSLPHLRVYDDGSKYMVIISQSKDGEIVAQLVEHLGLNTARGSKSRGGLKALLKVKRAMLEHNYSAIVTLDGPRGPRHKVKEGAVYLASKADALLVPVRMYHSRAKVFEKAWDKFRVPYPFSRCRILVGEPYELGEKELTEEALQKEMKKLETKMLELR